MAKTIPRKLAGPIRSWLKSLGVNRNARDAYLRLVLAQLAAKPVAGQKVVLYARSAASPDEREQVLKAQLAACREWAEAHSCLVVGEYQDVVNGLTKRTPELKRALTRARAEKAALVCISMDRLARSLTLLLKRQEECRRRGIALFFVR